MLLLWKSHLLCFALVTNMDVTMSACDFFLLQSDGKTILLGTDFGDVIEFNLMTGQVRENLSHRYHYCNCFGHLILVIYCMEWSSS